jgi:mannitol/fructose-specific phosphotransferase system IIA component (Ntr-type)
MRSAETAMKLLDLVHPKAIIPELASRDRNGAIRELVQVLADAKLIEAETVDSIVKSIIARERTRGTTGFGKGVAAPHAKIDHLSRVVAAVGRSSQGIDFQSLDVDLVFRHLQQERFRKFLRQCDDAGQVYDLLKEVDEKAVVT